MCRPPSHAGHQHGHGVVMAVDIGGRVWLFGPTPGMIRMSFATLAVISLVAIIGPLLALPRRWHLPIILGELAAGIVLGATGSGRLHADNETFTFLADIGFALIMFVVGAQVPVRDRRLRAALRIGVLRAVGV